MVNTDKYQRKLCQFLDAFNSLKQYAALITL